MNDITVKHNGNVTRIVLNRPDVLNALTSDMMLRLRELVREAPNRGARAILLSGHGRAFCSGADLRAASTGEMPPVEQTLGELLNPLIEAFAASPIPIVTGLNGLAAGAGVGLALSGDIVVAARSSYLMLPFATRAMVPDAGTTWLIARAIGRARTLELALLGERLSAHDALKAGLVNRICDDRDIESETAAMAERLAQMPTVALGMIRSQIAHAMTHDLSESLRQEAENQAKMSRTDDIAEGVAAFLEKRSPAYTGR